MKFIWYSIYNFIVIPFLMLFFNILALFNSKVKEGKKGRERIFEKLIIEFANRDRNKKIIWFHSSSLGEFEQAKPLIQELKRQKNIYIIVSFFSPSGYKNSLKYPYADFITYLPFDTPSNASRFLKHVKPNLAVFMRYDIWPNYIWKLKNMKIPAILVDATMNSKTKRKWPFAKSFHKNLFNSLHTILTVSEEDLINFKNFGLDKVILKKVGDTRFDRVFQKSNKAKEKNLIKEEILKNKKVFVLGSTWPEDEAVLFPAIVKLLKFDSDVLIIIAPHEPTVQRLEDIELSLQNESVIRFSHLNNYKNEKIILIDSIGILLSLYMYANFAFVGGSFKQGIHNVLEPAVYGIPVIFGPKMQNSQEAIKMVSLGCGIKIFDKKSAYRTIRHLTLKENEKNKIGKISSDFVKDNLGASKKINEEINKLI